MYVNATRNKEDCRTERLSEVSKQLRSVVATVEAR